MYIKLSNTLAHMQPSLPRGDTNERNIMQRGEAEYNREQIQMKRFERKTMYIKSSNTLAHMQPCLPRGDTNTHTPSDT